jgi:hypothetical protein
MRTLQVVDNDSGSTDCREKIVMEAGPEPAISLVPRAG